MDKKNTETSLVEESSYTSGCTNLGRDLYISVLGKELLIAVKKLIDKTT